MIGVGTTIGNFQLVAQLGRGGMGEVFLAEHVGIQTRVAVKLLHAEISRELEHVQRFFNEARIVSRIKHAGIVKIFDVGFHEERAYLIMELLEGETLAQRLVRGRMSATQIAEVGKQIASILDSTHKAGVTHRDLKPDNIFLVADDELGGRERVKILDFGIAKLAGPMAVGSSPSPKTIGAIGTPAYMAPEQWADSSKVSWHADAYALGCVLFEMGCGRTPFRCSSMAEACASHLHDRAPEMRSVYPDTPPALDTLVQRLLAKQPTERAISLAAVADELDALGSRVLPLAPTMGGLWQMPAPIPTPTTMELGSGERLAHPANRRPRLYALAGGVVALGLIITIAARSGSGSSDAPSSPSAAPTRTPAEATRVDPPNAPPLETARDAVRFEPPRQDPARVESAKKDPPRVETARVEPPKQNPPRVDPLKKDPLKKDPLKKDPLKKDPPKKDPPKKDPQRKDSPRVETVRVEPRKEATRKEVAKESPRKDAVRVGPEPRVTTPEPPRVDPKRPKIVEPDFDKPGRDRKTINPFRKKGSP